MTEITTFPQLFKKTSTGAIQQWKIYVSHENGLSTIVSEYGQYGGKTITSSELVKEGKNIGKSNETDIYQQAVSQAESEWTRQLKKGYVKTLQEAQQGKVDALIEGGIFPMLAQKFSEQGHKIKYPALAQPKLDGHRCIAQFSPEEVTLWSRTRKPITSAPHISQKLEDLEGIEYLDGELYNHDYSADFESLTSVIRDSKGFDEDEILQYHVYDMPHPTLTNGQRNEFLQSLKPKLEGSPIHIVETLVVNNEDELMEAFDRFLAEGYEGCIVRNMDGLYANKRSYDLQKVKEFLDDEFKVVDVEVSNKGRMAGKAIFVCETAEGVRFTAKMIGNLDNLTQYAEHPELAIGRMMTVKYQGITSKNRVPRFPVAMRFREDI